MKKNLLTAMASICLLLAISLPAMATATLSLYIDNLKVPTEPNICDTESGDTKGTYYMDIQPQLKNGRAFVPIQVIAKYLGAKIDWQSPHVLLTYGDTSLRLTPGSRTALKKDAELSLEAAPYVKDGRTMVPLRFITEAFGCKVGYSNSKVYIGTPPLYLDGKKVVSVQNSVRMTMGGMISECKTNVCINGLYRFLLDNAGDEIAAPDHYGSMVNMDVPDCYYLGNEFSFMASEGTDGAVIHKYQVYRRLFDDKTMTEMGFTGTTPGKVLLFDVTADKWYKLLMTDFNKYFSDIQSTGDWKEIFNNAV